MDKKRVDVFNERNASFVVTYRQSNEQWKTIIAVFLCVEDARSFRDGCVIDRGSGVYEVEAID